MLNKRKIKIWMFVILATVVAGSGIAFWTQQTGLYKGATTSTSTRTGFVVAPISTAPAPISCGTNTTAQTCSAVPGCNWLFLSSATRGTCRGTPISAGSPDLIVQSLSVNPANPQIDENVSFTAAVKNSGEAEAAESFIVRLRIDINNDNSWDINKSQSIEGLSKNFSKTVTFTNAWKAAAGTHRYRVCADAGPNISESNENNNCLVQNLVIAAAPAPQPQPQPSQPPPQEEPPPPPPQEEQPQPRPSFDFSNLGAAVSCAQQTIQAACNLASGCAWIDGSCRVSSQPPPPQEPSTPPQDQPPPGPQPSSPSPAALNISASLPQNQTTILNAGIQFVKAISIDLTKTGGDDAADKISGITLNLSGNFPKSKLKDEELWVKGDIEEKVTAATITKNPTKDVLSIGLPANYLLGANKKFILYVKAEVAEVDSARTFQYIVSGVNTVPASIVKNYADGAEAVGPEFTVAEIIEEELTCATGKIEQGGQCVCPAGKNEFSGGITFYTPNVCIPCTSGQLISSGGFYCPQDQPTPPPPPTPPTSPPPLSAAPPPPQPSAEEIGAQACAAQGKYVYTGPAKPGVRTPGMCIDCPTETYIKFGGKCEARKTAARSARPQIESPQATGAVIEQPSLPQTQTAARGAAPYPQGPQPSLQGSQRLVRAPERGQVGPGVAVYFGILAAIQGGIWLKKRYWKK